MNNDELQVLGKSRKLSKREKWIISIVAIVLLALVVVSGMAVHRAFPPEQTEKIKTGKKMGEPIIIPELQQAVDSLLNARMSEINCLQGQAIVMEVQTGEILAMSGLERNFEGKFQPCKNFGYQQELGSLMKTASLLAVLETGKVKIDDVVDTGNGIWPVDNERLMKDHNWRRGGYGTITLARALEISSNIGIGKAVERAFGNNQQEFFNLLDKMSFGQPNHIDGIDGLKVNKYSSPKDSNWISRRIWWSAIGYERLIAPIQMLTFYNAIANDGRMVKPTLKTGEIEVINPQIASKENIKKMQVILEHVVSQGLGRKAGSPLIRVAGKTGTSQVGEYEFGEDTYVTEYQMAFCGYFPADAPRYSIIVSMNKLGLPASGGGMGGPVFHYIMNWIITHDLLPLLVVDDETSDTIHVTESTLDRAYEILHRHDDE